MRVAYLLIALLLVSLVPASESLAGLHARPAPQPLRHPIEGFTQPTHAPVPETNVGIGPGGLLVIQIPDEGSFICSANFVWTAGAKTYLGSAGHCFLPTDKQATHGPGADYSASGVRVYACVWGCSFGGASSSLLAGNLVALGEVVYARQRTGNDAVGEDFGLVEIPANVMHLVRPTLPVWGGPTSPGQGSGFGPVCHYGNGLLVGESFTTMARAGYGMGTFADGSWDAVVAINSGDSGSAIIMCGTEGTNGTGGIHGRAPLGIVTHGIGVAAVGVPGYGTGTTVAKAKAMSMQAGLAIELVHAP